MLRFVGLTALGSVIWNTLLIGAGYVLGTQYDRIEGYLRYLDYVVVLAVILWSVCSSFADYGSGE